MPVSNGEPPMTTTATRIAHAIPLLLVTMIVIRVLWYVGRMPGFIDLAFTMVLGAAYIVMLFHFMSARLCLPCLRNIPLDPQGEVRQWGLLLRWHHTPPRTDLCILGAALVLTWIGAWLGGWALIAFRIPLDVIWFVLIYTFWIHHRLRPWCPYCRRWDDGGDPELVPDPDPAEGKRIT